MNVIMYKRNRFQTFRIESETGLYISTPWLVAIRANNTALLKLHGDLNKDIELFENVQKRMTSWTNMGHVISIEIESIRYNNPGNSKTVKKWLDKSVQDCKLFCFCKYWQKDFSRRHSVIAGGIVNSDRETAKESVWRNCLSPLYS